MWGWFVSIFIAALGGVGIWYYRAKLSQAAQLDDLVKANTQVLSDLNTLLAKLAADANKAATKDLEDAKKISTAADAAAFLGGSVHITTDTNSSPFGIVYTPHSVLNAGA